MDCYQFYWDPRSMAQFRFLKTVKIYIFKLQVIRTNHFTLSRMKILKVNIHKCVRLYNHFNWLKGGNKSYHTFTMGWNDFWRRYIVIKDSSNIYSEIVIKLKYVITQLYIQLVFKAPPCITLTISDQKIVSGSLFLTEKRFFPI